MTERYVLDAFAVLALMGEEAGADIVAGILSDQDNDIYMSSINVGEVYYILARRRGKQAADAAEEAIYDNPRLKVAEADRIRIHTAAQIKSLGKLSLADCFAAALAKEMDAALATGDREFAALESQGLSLCWLPGKPPRGQTASAGPGYSGRQPNDFCDETKDFKEEMRLSKESTDKQWTDLARKMGTLIEDIFAPSLNLVIEKYFKLVPKDVTIRRRIRKNDETLALDILAYAGEKAFVLEVMSSPNRHEYVQDFINKLQTLPLFIPEIKNYEIVPIYAALDMDETTIHSLTRNNIFAMVVRNDILEIVNFEAIAEPK